MPRPAIVEIVAVDRGDHDMLQPERATASPTLLRLASSSASGSPVRTLQKAQARVQVSPMIMKVAWRFDQHSPILGQPASSQTVTSPCSRTIAHGLAIDRRARRLDPDPVGLAQDRCIGPLGLFGMARAFALSLFADREGIEDGDHRFPAASGSLHPI
jgi:hypothetical protein